MEEYTSSDFKTEGFIIYFIELVVFWHFFSRLMRACFEIDRKQYSSMWGLFFTIIAILIAKIVYTIFWAKGVD
jgi:hypothetical protein